MITSQQKVSKAAKCETSLLRWNKLLYSVNIFWIGGLLFLAILVANEIGFRVGRLYENRAHPEIKTHTLAIQAGMLGLLALLLGFGFHMALDRYNQRTLHLVDEAGAIHEAMLRSKLLVSPYNNEAKELLEKYLEARLAFSDVDSIDKNALYAYEANLKILQKAIWDVALRATSVDSREVTVGLFIRSINRMIEKESMRTAYYLLQVPEIILWVLFIIFIAAGGLMGFSSGLSQKRIQVPTIMMTLLIVLVIVIIMDLDRPKRGIIRVSQESLEMLKEL